MNVKIKGIEEYDLDNDEKTKFTLVTFDFTTAKGTVELHENVNFGYNDYIYVEKVDSNVRCNEDDLYNSIVSEDDDFCIGDVLEAVEKEINNRKKYTVKDAKGNVLKSFDFLSEVRDYLWDIVEFRKFENGLTGCTVSNFFNNSTVTLDWDNVDIINNIYHRKLVCDECCDNFAEAWHCEIIGTSVNGNIIMQEIGGCHCRCEINATIYEQIHFTDYDDFGNVMLDFGC